MTLRIRLVLLSLLTLVLPWAGCEYARQMESVLSKGQGDALLATARVLETVVSMDPAFSLTPNAPDEHGPIFAVQLLTYALDGFSDEWPEPARAPPTTSDDLKNLRLGIYGGAYILFLHISDNHIVYEVPHGEDDESAVPTLDRVIVKTTDTSGVARAWSISAVAPGPVIVRPASTTLPWKAAANSTEELRGVWRATGDGYDIELRIPQRLAEAQLGVAVVDDAAAATNDITMHALRSASEELRTTLQRYAPDGVRVSLVDADGWLIARAGTLNRSSATSGDELPNFYRWLLARNEVPAPTYGLPYGMWGPPVDSALHGKGVANWFAATSGDPSTVRAAVPITKEGHIVGAIAVEQAGEQLLRERDSALAGLLKLALLATTLAVIATLAFAAWISRRIRRLSIAASTALSPEGRIEQRLPDMTARDELGDLARSFASLLHRINEYALYLQTLGSKLSHEFRTPLAIVSSSLDNLAAEKLDGKNGAIFIERAREGTARLQAILSAMTEATRVEQSIDQAEQVSFDLADLIRSAASAYQQTFASHQIVVLAPDHPCIVKGAPELIAQMLDKLVDNASDFCPPQGRITLELVADPKFYRLTVSNEGPLLPPEAEYKIFDMLVSQRTSSGSAKPHLGLGLYIVQLIARFHRGDVAARNLPDATGVAFDVRIAR